jgi:hypothetical protein
MGTEEPHCPLRNLQPGDIGVQIHSIDAFEVEHHVPVEDLTHTIWYSHGRLQLTRRKTSPLDGSKYTERTSVLSG